MPITLTIPDEIAHAAQTMAGDCGATAERLLIDALRAHFPAVPPELRAEFDAWEQASNEDCAVLPEVTEHA